MQALRRLCLAALVAFFSGAPLAGAQSAPTMADRFGWLAGCWAGQSAMATFKEAWMSATSDMMTGMSVTIPSQPGRAASFEFLRITRSKDGVFAYLAQPSGAAPTPFTLGDLSKPDLSLFVNEQHDFPKRIGYQRVDANSLLAWIDGGEGARKIEYPMKRATSCLQ
jgi:hypothetical protein